VSDERARHDLPLLDGVRALAALMVLITHVGFDTGASARGPAGALLARLDAGVALFFALSGMLLLRPWLGDAPLAVRTYGLRRAVRILPAYWVVLAAALLTTARGASPGAAVRNALLLQTYRGPLLPGLTQTWSLCTEVAFYALLPLAAPFVARGSATPTGRRRLLVLMALGCLFAWTWAAVAATALLPPLASTWLPGHLDWFLVGMALALAEQRIRAQPAGALARARAEVAARPGSLLLLALAVLWLAGTPLGGPRTLAPPAPGTAALKEALYAVIAGLVLAAVAASDQRRGTMHVALGGRSVQALGRVSYGVFLWHVLVLAGAMALLHRPVFGGGFFPVLALTLAGTLLVSAVSWQVLESPLLSRVHRRPTRVPDRPSSPSPGG